MDWITLVYLLGAGITAYLLWRWKVYALAAMPYVAKPSPVTAAFALVVSVGAITLWPLTLAMAGIVHWMSNRNNES